jgi:hypothetical protein
MQRSPSKQPRSLKIDVPSPEELKPAKREILSTSRRLDWERESSINEDADPEGWKRKKKIIQKITDLLWVHKMPGKSRISLNNLVVQASLITRPHAKPAVVAKITTEVVKAARQLHRLLGNEDLLPNHVFRICGGDTDNWYEFIQCLERATALIYVNPPKNRDPVKQVCVRNAYLLITQCTTRKPTKTRGALFYTIADLLYQINFPQDDERRDRLKFICDDLLDRVKEGFDPARNRTW